MADQKLTDLTADTAPTSDDLIYVVNDPSGTPGSRKVALSNIYKARYDGYKARAYNNASQTNITDVTWTTVVLDTESYDSGSNFDSASNYEYVIPVDGIYRVYGQVMLVNMVASKTYASGIWQAATSLLAANYLPMGSDTTQNATMPVQYTGSFTAGQSIRLRVICYCGANTVDIQAGSAYTYLEVEFLGAT